MRFGARVCHARTLWDLFCGPTLPLTDFGKGKTCYLVVVQQFVSTKYQKALFDKTSEKEYMHALAKLRPVQGKATPRSDNDDP